MLKATKKPKTPNMIWDAENNRLLCKFVKGVFETDDGVVAEKLKDMGYEIIREEEQAEGVEPTADKESETGTEPLAENEETPKSTTGGRKRAAK